MNKPGIELIIDHNVVLDASSLITGYSSNFTTVYLDFRDLSKPDEETIDIDRKEAMKNFLNKLDDY